MKTPIIIAVVGLPGAGKTEATARFVKHQFARVGFNDIFYEEFDRWGLERNQNNGSSPKRVGNFGAFFRFRGACM
jgi:hypothetical protein